MFIKPGYSLVASIPDCSNCCGTCPITRAEEMRQLATPDMRQFPGRLSWQDFTSIHPSNTPMVLGVVLFSSSILTTIQLRVQYVHFYYRGGHPEDLEGPPIPSFKLQFLTINFISFYAWNRKIWGFLRTFPFCKIL